MAFIISLIIIFVIYSIFFKKDLGSKGILKSIFVWFGLIFAGIFGLIIALIAMIIMPFLFKGNILNQQFRSAKNGYAEYLIALIAKIAKLDGVVSKREAEFISQMLDASSFNAIEREKLKQIFKVEKENPHNYKEVAQKLAERIGYSKNEALKILQVLLHCASIDGFSEIKISAIKEIANILGVGQEFDQFVNFGKNQNTKSTPKKDPYETLGVSKNASMDEIKSAYRKLVKKYHPDILNAKNLSEKEIKEGIEKFREINEAYEYLKDQK